MCICIAGSPYINTLPEQSPTPSLNSICMHDLGCCFANLIANRMGHGATTLVQHLTICMLNDRNP